MQDCLFCRIVRGEIPAAKVYEDEHVFAFKDIQLFNSHFQRGFLNLLRNNNPLQCWL